MITQVWTQEKRDAVGKRMSGSGHWNWKGGVSTNKKEYQKKWIEKNKSHVREYDRKNKVRWNYGVSFDEYEKIYISQYGKCAICKTSESEFKKRLAIDHNHKTGKVRGLLCNLCNFSLGGFRDNIDLLNSAIAYLSKEK